MSAAAGIVDSDGGSPMTVDTPYLLASITKMYTARCDSQAAMNRGASIWTIPLAIYLPGDLLKGLHVLNGTEYSRELKVSQLVSQTSGLPDYFEDKPRGGLIKACLICCKRAMIAC